MHYCSGCDSMVYALFTTPFSTRLCDECSDLALTKPRKISRPRDYNNTKYELRKRHGSITNWARQNGFNPKFVNVTLNRKVAHFDEYTAAQIKMLNILKQQGLAIQLEVDNYIPKGD